MSGGTRVLTTPTGDVVVRRDEYGIPHVSAGDEPSAWFGLGYAAAEDRLWQMEYDRRRACGRWAEAAGQVALPADRLARRLDLRRAATRDVTAMDEATRERFEGYAAGVNARAAEALPPEYEVTGLPWEPWRPWHSVAAFKIRHVLMGVWQYKLARATLLARDGLAAFQDFDPTPRPGMWVTVPAGARLGPRDAGLRALLDEARADIEATAEQLGFLAEVEGGSNAWAVAGTRTTSGLPVLCNDSHRALDVPNVYWQAHLTCPGFRVSGATFPGLPGFPHFGHNGTVGWAITNAAADAQDLLIERFRGDGDSLEVRVPSGWAPVTTTESVIVVRDAEPQRVTCHTTPNGPVIHGDPRTGLALSLRWTATDRACEQFGVLRRMLDSETVTEMLDAQAPWVDPVNNFLAADTAGNIGYTMRGELPRRRRPAALQIPVPGWDTASEWTGRVPVSRLPRQENPASGAIVSANNVVVEGMRDLVISHALNDMYRVERIHEMLDGRPVHSVDRLAGYQGDVVSAAARRWAQILERRGPYTGNAEEARSMIAASRGALNGTGGAALVHACFRRTLAETLIHERLSEAAGDFLLRGSLPGAAVLTRRWFAQLTWPIDSGSQCPADDIPDATLKAALEHAWSDARRTAGDDPTQWRWNEHHCVAGRHTLASSGLGMAWNPPCAGIGGDNETVQNASYDWPRGAPFTVTNCSVYRQVLDFADLANSKWVIPGGASGDPTSPHYADQLPIWQRHALLDMEDGDI